MIFLIVENMVTQLKFMAPEINTFWSLIINDFEAWWQPTWVKKINKHRIIFNTPPKIIILDPDELISVNNFFLLLF